MSAAQWGELVDAWQKSGESAVSFALAHGIAESSLRWWKTELARRARKEGARQSPGPGGRRPATVTLARVVREGEDVRLPSVSVVVGLARIVVEEGFDGRLLRDVVRALGESR